MNWKKEPLGKICKTTSGGTPSRKNQSYYQNGIIPWVKSGELENNIITTSEEFITEEGLLNSSAKIFPAGTLLIALYGATIGKLAFLGIEASTNQAVCGIFQNEKVSLKYLYYYLLFQRPSLIKQGVGGAQPNISQAILKKTEVLYPDSIREQQRIVSNIEKLFSELDKAVDTLKTTKEQLAVYRQAVLKDAFSDFEKKDSIRNLTMVVTSGSRGWAKYYSNSGALFVRIGNLTHSGIDIDFRDIQHITPPDNAEGVRTRLQPNDVLVSITADLGSIGFVSEKVEEAYINQHIALVRFQNPVQGRFMAWYLRSEYGQKDLLKNKRGGGKLGLGLDDIRDTPVPIVDDITATEIVDKVEEQLSVCDSIEKTVDTALAQADAMRQSILKQAFEGKL